MAAKLIPSTVQKSGSIIPVNMAVQKRLKKWDRIETLLDQDEEKITKNFCKKLPNEPQPKFADRQLTYIDTFVNISQDLVTAPINSVFSQGLKINYGSNNSVIKKFNTKVTRSSKDTPIQSYMHDVVGLQLRAFGSCCTIIDKPSIIPKNLEDELKNGMPYLTTIRLQDIINWQLDEFGGFDWFLYRKSYVPNWDNPFFTDRDPILDLECLYTKTDYIVREKNGNIIPELSFTHNFGFVPVVIQGSFTLNENELLGNSAMFQSSNSIINMNNCLNVGNYELYKHGAALLLMNEDAVQGANLETTESGDADLKTHNKGGVLTWAGEIEPGYLVKDIRSGDFMTWAEYYRTAAVENERDLKSVAKKGASGEMVQESGFAKMVDREPLEANLVSLSEDLELWYNQVVEKVSEMLNKPNDSIIEFDRDYDLRSIKQKYEELQLAISSKCEKVSPSLFKEHYKNIAPDVTRDQELLVVINKEIDEYNPDEFENKLNEEVEKQFNFGGNKKI